MVSVLLALSERGQENGKHTDMGAINKADMRPDSETVSQMGE